MLARQSSLVAFGGTSVFGCFSVTDAALLKALLILSFQELVWIFAQVETWLAQGITVVGVQCRGFKPTWNSSVLYV